MKPPTIETHVRMVLLEWVIIIATARIFGLLGRRFGQTLAVGEILAGLLLGPSALGLIWPASWAPLFPPETQQSLQLLGRLGILLLLFQVGMEFDFGHLTVGSRTVVAVSLLGIVGPALGGIAMAPWLHEHFAPQLPFRGFELYICVALSITALPIMGRILLEMRLERTALGALAISAAAIDDVLGWIGLAVITALVSSQFSWGVVVLRLAGVVGWALALHFVVGPLLRRLWKGLAGSSVPGEASKMPATYLAVLLVCLFGSCLVTDALGVHTIFGAFLLGTALHQQIDLVKAWREQTANFVLIALVPVFFTNSGLRTQMNSIDSGAGWIGCGLVLFVGAAGKLTGCWMAGRFCGLSHRAAASIAALMNTRALMGLIAINVGYDLGLLPRELFTMFVIMSLVTTAMTGPLLRLWLPDDLRPLAFPPADTARARRETLAAVR